MLGGLGVNRTHIGDLDLCIILSCLDSIMVRKARRSHYTELQHVGIHFLQEQAWIVYKLGAC